MEIKKGDNVVVIAGKDKGKKGKVLETSPKSAKVVVEGVNIVTKHKKPRSAQDKGGIVKQTNPIDSSNVIVVCSTCGKATRIGHKEIDGKKATFFVNYTSLPQKVSWEGRKTFFLDPYSKEKTMASSLLIEPYMAIMVLE